MMNSDTPIATGAAITIAMVEVTRVPQAAAPMPNFGGESSGARDPIHHKRKRLHVCSATACPTSRMLVPSDFALGKASPIT